MSILYFISQVIPSAHGLVLRAWLRKVTIALQSSVQCLVDFA